MRYLLDTNTVTDLIHYPQGRVAQRIHATGVERICVSIIVAAELRFGAEKKGSPRLRERVDTVLRFLAIIPFAPPADTAYGRLRAQLEKAGTPIGNNDLLIAAHAIALGYTVVTNNQREFARIGFLPRENWLV